MAKKLVKMSFDTKCFILQQNPSFQQQFYVVSRCLSVGFHAYKLNDLKVDEEGQNHGNQHVSLSREEYCLANDSPVCFHNSMIKRQ